MAMKRLICRQIDLDHVADVSATTMRFDGGVVVVASMTAPTKDDIVERTECRVKAPWLTPHKKTGRLNLYLKNHTTGAGASFAPTGSAGVWLDTAEHPYIQPFVRLLTECTGPESGSVPVDEPHIVSLYYYP